MDPKSSKRRRDFLNDAGKFGTIAFVAGSTPKLSGANDSLDKNAPNMPCGIMTGDVGQNSATIWVQADRASQMLLEISQDEGFKNATSYPGPNLLHSTDFTGRLTLRDLKPGTHYFARVTLKDLNQTSRRSAPKVATFTTASRETEDVRFAWSGDTAGQGYGIDVSRGGMKTYESIRQLKPNFFVHSGDTIYADGPFPSELQLPGGKTWRNIVTEGTSKVAETIDEFRANYKYNFLDENVRRFNAEIPVLAQWDDHETTNNWYPDEQFKDDSRYSVESVSLLAARAKQAFLEFTPLGSNWANRIHRKIRRGPLLDLFFLDLRSFRGPNSPNRQEVPSATTEFLGKLQLQWLKRSLKSSTAKWKVICSDMPLGLVVGDGKNFENSSNGDGPVLGREFEIASLLRHIKQNSVKNVVFITADVHYAASHHYSPDRAVFQDFDPFWEFVSGPLHAGTFGPGKLDNTFGPRVEFCGIPNRMQQNLSPDEGYQFFGLIEINGDSQNMTVKHFNREGVELWHRTLEPA